MSIFKMAGITIVLALLLNFAGCGSNVGQVVSEELHQRILASADEVVSYRFEGSVTMSSADNPDIDVTFDYDGALDLENAAKSMISVGVSGESSVKLDMYLFTDILHFGAQANAVYSQVTVNDVPEGWRAWKVTTEYWEEQDELARRLDILSLAEVKHGGSEKIDGTDCYVLDVVLDTTELADYVLKQPMMSDLLPGFSATELSDMIGEMNARKWVAKDTSLPLQSQITFSFTYNEVVIDIETETRLYDFNSSLDISLPEECTDWLAQENRTAIVETSMGTIEIELYEKRAPITTANFISLAGDEFYDGLIFHRVIDDFMIQGGDPVGDGTGGSEDTIDLEVHPDLPHVDGAVSMARSTDPNSASSQFFICDGAQTYLDGQYAVFGVVTDGIEVVRAIASVETDDNDKPVTDVVINTITIE